MTVARPPKPLGERGSKATTALADRERFPTRIGHIARELRRRERSPAGDHRSRHESQRRQGEAMPDRRAGDALQGQGQAGGDQRPLPEGMQQGLAQFSRDTADRAAILIP